VDLKVSRKETRLQPGGVAEVLVSNIFDLYPVFGNDERFAWHDQLTIQDREDLANLIVDAEILDGDREELLDRAMWAVVKQRGADPVEPEDGIPWAEAVLEEVPAPVIMQQVHRSVAEEGPGVRAAAGTVKRGSKETLNFTVTLTNAV
jgi:hypothetical protein